MGHDWEEDEVDPYNEIDGGLQIPAHNDDAQMNNHPVQNVGMSTYPIDAPVYNILFLLWMLSHGSVGKGVDQVSKDNNAKANPESNPNLKGKVPQGDTYTKEDFQVGYRNHRYRDVKNLPTSGPPILLGFRARRRRRVTAKFTIGT